MGSEAGILEYEEKWRSPGFFVTRDRDCTSNYSREHSDLRQILSPLCEVKQNMNTHLQLVMERLVSSSKWHGKHKSSKEMFVYLGSTGNLGLGLFRKGRVTYPVDNTTAESP